MSLSRGQSTRRMTIRYGQDNEDERDNLVKYVHANTTFGFKFESQLKAYLSGKPVDANGPKERAVYRTLVQHVIARKPLAEVSGHGGVSVYASQRS
ncbi:hypothetical protein SARC_06808 [Sphaeroforma arctica JP610]|uniref:Uncharacterized protein n=1 Tax=Sphaeroforma arctica JP610 TaxID=667725 RepID=A0A0L0FVI1_9EUKA|nr:hypothetical protein SARC_06808 [Sphaeroforma arctica JP610]KNC80847.1 hypothetical protein SARC_06808 [Sphaeroforma arctica JP610]|eukprot:XP_014154749.1 hypothetical protein SARC_06808 [Sphaeroforma arctica JP610]